MHPPPSSNSRMADVSYKRKYKHKVLVNRFVKLVVRLTDRLVMSIAVDWDVKPQTKHVQVGLCPSCIVRSP